MKILCILILGALQASAQNDLVEVQPTVVQQDRCSCLLTRSCSTHSWCYINYIKTKLRNGLQLSIGQKYALWRWERCRGGCAGDTVPAATAGADEATNSVQVPIRLNMMQRRRVEKSLAKVIRSRQGPATNTPSQAIRPLAGESAVSDSTAVPSSSSESAPAETSTASSNGESPTT